MPMANSSTLLGILLLIFFLIEGQEATLQEIASTPPRGWNSYDSFSWTISEKEFLDNAQIVSDKLLQHGYEYVVVDYLWYRKLVPGASTNSPGYDVIDEWGRPIPDPGRWPSSAGGKGFKAVADRVHQMGLKFGIHVMRGISTQAVNANTLILGPNGQPYQEGGRIWRAGDIGSKEAACKWMPACFMSVNFNMGGASAAFLRSLYQQYADWGVDFVKHDCVFGDDLELDEITTVSQILKNIDRPIVYSISPGTNVTPRMALQINSLVNMYRVTSDDWDTWQDVEPHFNVARDFAFYQYIGAQGLRGKSWPDLDMLPFGKLSNVGSNEGPHRTSNLTLDEQKTQVTLWAMAKSPLIFGGDLRNVDNTTLGLITNPTVLDINAYSTKNKEFPNITSTQQHLYHYSKSSQSFAYSNITKGFRYLLSLCSCKDKKANNWVISMNQLCWKGHLNKSYGSKLCLNWRTHFSQLGQASINKEHDRRKYHIFSSTNKEVCLDSSPNRVSTFGIVKSNHFSPCSQQASQEWELTHDGALLNNYARLCTSVTPIEDGSIVSEQRAWVASGKKGEIYVSFFNLSPNPSTISTKVEDVVTFLGENKVITKNKGMSQSISKCRALEVWSGQKLGVINDTISMEVSSHGCALLEIDCD